MLLNSKQPIGIFDSGAGGLTVASAVRNLLPEEKIIYFGDTAHLPYGEKSREAIKHYSVKISDFLLKKNCKVILIACNTASAAAYQTVKMFVGSKALVLDVVNPATEFAAKNEKLKKIGVIGTKRTIISDTYAKKILEINPRKKVISLATPLLVPMIEEGFIYDNISNAIINKYLSDSRLQNIDSLILACTHYPIIKNQIRKFYNFKTNIIDSSQIVARKLKKILSEKKLFNNNENPEHEFFVSDYTDFFKIIAEMFFDDEVNPKELNIFY